MTGSHPIRTTIVGAGLGGALMANYMARAGHAVTLLEKRADPRTARQVFGRSINLALSTRGLEALREIGLADEIMQTAVPMRGRMIHAPDGHLAYQPYGVDDSQAINSVSRIGLNVLLLNAAERYPNVQIEFGARCTGIIPDSGSIDVAGSDGKRRRVHADVIVGADGVNSQVRRVLVQRPRFDYRQDFLSHGYKELHIPPGPGGSFRMEKNALHIWPRRSYMMIALPNEDGSYTVTLFWPFEGPNSFADLKTPESVTAYFKEHFADAVPLMPNFVHDYLKVGPSAMVTVRCAPWYLGDRVVLIGDAAHGVVPFYGQGMNAAFESCSVLNRCLIEHGADREAAFRDYFERRKPNTDALAELAVENFLEMRDKVGSPAFLRKKQMEKTLARLFPRWYLPLYSMVSFSLMPYAAAIQRAGAQDRFIRRATLAVLGVLILGLAWFVLRPR